MESTQGILLQNIEEEIIQKIEIPVQQTVEDIGMRKTDSYGCRRRQVNSPVSNTQLKRRIQILTYCIHYTVG